MARPKKTVACIGDAPLTKAECILAAARQVFLEAGYAAASMDAVAARANVSKATIYAHFENKRALFEAVISGRCEETFANIGVPETYTDARQALLHLARHFLGLLLAPEALAIHRVVLGESPRLPEVGEAFYTAGPMRAYERVGRLLADLTRRGLLAVPEQEIPLAGDLFLAMLKCDLHTRALLLLPPSQHSIETVAKVAVDMFLARYRPVRQ